MKTKQGINGAVINFNLKKFISVYCAVLFICLGIIVSSDSAYATEVIYASGLPYYSDGIYSATAEDGAKIMLYRYKPSADSEYRTGGTPVLLFPAIITSMTEYFSSTPPERKKTYAGMVLKEPYADWAIARDTGGNRIYDSNGKAVLEKHIKADPMLYYNIAHYLWLQGFDPWFTNYRDTGRGKMRSKNSYGKQGLVTLDTWLNLDAPAAVAKVKEVTGKRLYIGGHSTGGFAAYAYLQGCYMDAGGTDGGSRLDAFKNCYDKNYQPHVKSDPNLAKERNADIKGYIGLDPAGIPPLPSWADLNILYNILTLNFYVNLDLLCEYTTANFAMSGNLLTIQMLFGSAYPIDMFFLNMGLKENLFAYFDAFYVNNANKYVQDFMARYALSGASIRCFGQYANNGIKYTNREFWMNGYENRNRLSPPDLDPGNDGYYYYSENMKLFTVPALCVVSSSLSMVNIDVVNDTIMSKKTKTDFDQVCEVAGSSHMDLVFGLSAPTEVFPVIGAWLARVEANDAGGAGNITDDEQSMVAGCGSEAEASSYAGSKHSVLPGLMSMIIMTGLPLSVIMLRRVVRRRKQK